MSEEKQEPKKSKAGYVIAALLGVAVVFWLLSAIGSSSSSSPSRQSLPAAPTTHTVRYYVGGTAQTADITIENETGGTEQKTIDIPWDTTFSAERGQFVYVSAQSNDDAERLVNCKIEVDGEILESAESRGRFVIASCSGSVGR